MKILPDSELLLAQKYLEKRKTQGRLFYLNGRPVIRISPGVYMHKKRLRGKE